MNPQNKAILDECRQHWDFFKRTETIPSGMNAISFHQLKELERIMSEEFLPGYKANFTGCGPCIVDHLRFVYKKYDEWIAAQPKEEPLIVAASFPVNDHPVLAPLEVSIDSGETYKRLEVIKVVKFETPEQRKARLADPNRVIKRRAKRK